MRTSTLRPLALFAAFALPIAAPADARADDADEAEQADDPKLDRGATDEEPEVDAPPSAAEKVAGEALALPDLSVLSAEPVHGLESSGFGWRDDPIRHHRRFHCGADYRAARGTPVHAAAAGTVLFCGRRGGYGRSIDLQHGAGLVTRYAHLARIAVHRGETVAADDRIGDVGSTGRATGPHLHFEVRIEGRAVDPILAVRVGSIQHTESPEVVRAAALDLAPETQERSISAIDPPRDRHHGMSHSGKDSGKHSGKVGQDRRVRRRPNLS